MVLIKNHIPHKKKAFGEQLRIGTHQRWGSKVKFIKLPTTVRPNSHTDISVNQNLYQQYTWYITLTSHHITPTKAFGEQSRIGTHQRWGSKVKFIRLPTTVRPTS